MIAGHSASWEVARGLHENLVDAEAAILFVRKICGIRADNFDQPEFVGEAAAPGKVGASRADSGRLLNELSSAMLARYDLTQRRQRLVTARLHLGVLLKGVAKGVAAPDTTT